MGRFVAIALLGACAAGALAIALASPAGPENPSTVEPARSGSHGRLAAAASHMACLKSWNADASAARAIASREGMRVVSFTTWRDGGSNTGRKQCVAMLREGARGPWMIFGTVGKAHQWQTEPDARGRSYGTHEGNDSPEGPPGLTVNLADDGIAAGP